MNGNKHSTHQGFDRDDAPDLSGETGRRSSPRLPFAVVGHRWPSQKYQLPSAFPTT